MARPQAYCNVHYANMRKKKIICQKNRQKYKNTDENGGDNEKILINKMV